MKTTNQCRSQPLSLQETGFGSYQCPPAPPSGHVHEAIEISAIEKGSASMLYGGREITIPSDHLIVHWGMLPHQALHPNANTLLVGIHIPLSWFLQWEIPGTLTERILNLELLIEPPRKEPCSDVSLLQNWHRILSEYGKEAESVVLAESRARLMRMALHARASSDTTHLALTHQPSAVFYRALELIARNFREPIRIADIADHSGLSARHLARVFHEYTGQTINAYLTRLRLSHAQRLLVTTDRTVTDIMYDAGFTCPTHFYKVFRNQTGQTPAKYRSPG